MSAVINVFENNILYQIISILNQNKYVQKYPSPDQTKNVYPGNKYFVSKKYCPSSGLKKALFRPNIYNNK